MKKIFSIMASVALAAVALTGCDDNTDPKAQVPQSNDFLNTPPTANYTYNLTETPTVTLTCSQPNFGGVATIPAFAVQLSLDPKFASVPAEWKFDDPASTPLNFVELPSSYNTYTIEGDTLTIDAGTEELEDEMAELLFPLVLKRAK